MPPFASWIPARCRSGAVLERLRGSPVNCLVVEWPGVEPALIRRARDAGLAVVGDAGESTRVPATAASARAAGLDALIGPPEGASDFIFPGAPLAALPRSGAWPAVVVRECVWPGIRTVANGSASAGPTGAPWIDSNGWIARLAAALAPGKAVWLDFAPPAGEVLSPDRWALAAAEAAAHGARWILPADALEPPAWDAVSRTLAFFAAHHGWPREAASPLAVISDFAGPNEFLSHEFLNLSARRNLPARIFERSRTASLGWEGIRTILYADGEAPPPALLARLLEAVRGGALLIAPPQFAALVKGPDAGEAACPGYRLVTAGKGRAAIATQPWEDPFLLAGDVQSLMGRRHAPMRLWNALSILPLPVGAGNRPSVVHLIRYTSRSGDPVTLGLPERRSGATFYSPESEPVRLKAHAVRQGAEFYLPPFQAYGAVVLEG